MSKMIVDFSQIAISSLFAIDKSGNEFNEDFFRHVVLNSLRSIRKKFKHQYKDTIIAIDSSQSWRKTVFPYYKANRKKSRDESNLDWNLVFQYIHQYKQEIKEHFPYIVIDVDQAEADDVIGVLCERFGTEFLAQDDILIVSGDKDFSQLQKYSNVKQYAPIQERWIEVSDPEKFLFEHIIRGDTGDGIPNCLSPIDSLVNKIRQKPVMQKKLDEWYLSDIQSNFSTEMLSRYSLNRELIDLTCVPQDIKNSINSKYDEEIERLKIRTPSLYKYFVDKKLSNLIDNINDF